MRHLWSLLAGVVVAPITWLLVAMGQGGSTRTVAGWVDDGRYDTTSLIEPAAYLLTAGILLGLLGTLRISPLGPLVAGLLLIGAYAGMFVAPFAIHDNVPGNERIFGRPLPLHLPLDDGTLLLLGALMVMATFSAQRWRRWPAASVASTDAATVGDGTAERAATDDPTTAPTGTDDPISGVAEPGAADEPAPPGDDEDRAAEPTPAEPGAPAVPTQRSGDDPPEPANALPRRRDSRSPWSSPPQTAAKESGSD